MKADPYHLRNPIVKILALLVLGGFVWFSLDFAFNLGRVQGHLECIAGQVPLEG